jgi:hypothetical protein
MRNVLIAAFSLVALAGSANAAAPKHKWFGLNYGTGSCDPMPLTPEQFYSFGNASSGETGTTIDRISPENVTKDASGAIHVHLTGSRPSGGAQWDFFTSKDECDRYVKDEGIAPEQAPTGDIN